MSLISPSDLASHSHQLSIIPEPKINSTNQKSITFPLTSPIPTNHYKQQHQHQQFQIQYAIQPPSSELPIKYIQTAPINFPTSPTSIPINNDNLINNPTSTTSFASFEITSGSISQSPYYSSLFLSPHNPPFEPDLCSPRNPQQLPPAPPSSHPQQQYHHNSLSMGGFNSLMEDRYSRFRPLDSQHNNENIMIGLHPFQQENYGIPKKKLFNSMTNWFKRKSSSSTSPSTNLILSNNNNNNLQIVNEEEEEEEEGEGDGEKSSSIENTIIISNEPNDITPQPVYTPRGIPINEFPLNFNKEQNNENNLIRNRNRNDDIIDSFDDEVRDLINGVDNFLINCLENVWNLTKSTSDYCLSLCA